MRQKHKRRLRQRRGTPFRATAQCENCGDEFTNHEYVKDSITQYKCPHPIQESGYGYGYRGIDPRHYSPDGECCSTEELAEHKSACEMLNRGREYKGNYRFGIGIYTIEFDQFFKPREHDYDRERNQ